MDVALFGAAGYAGVELAKLVAGHPQVRLACAASDSHAGRRLDQLTGRDHAGLAFVTTEAAREIAARCGLAFLAVPPEPARAIARALRPAVRVIDLSHAHRGDAEAVYGLVSLFEREIASASLIANPGCYATAIITACAPLVRHGLVQGDLAIAAGSGVTGAGRTTDEAMSLGEMYGDVRAYRVLRHQHVPEIEAALARVGTPPGRAILTTHLLPIARGIFATITARLARPMSSAALVERFRADYDRDPTTIVADAPEDVSLRRVVGTNTCMIGVASDDRGALVVTCAIDNLLKGAAGQAVENMNVMLGYSRTTGLEHLARHG